MVANANEKSQLKLGLALIALAVVGFIAVNLTFNGQTFVEKVMTGVAATDTTFGPGN